MKSLTTILFISLLSGYHAQQEPLSSMFWNNYTLFNPAATGLFYKHQANVMYRDQWDKVNGAPRTLTANYNTKLDFLHGGIGVNYMHDNIGFTNTDRINLNYSYHLQLGKEGVLAAGISAGLIHTSIVSSWTPPTTAPDPTLPSSHAKGNAFAMNFGLVYKTERLNIGLSSTNLNEPTVKEMYFTYARHYYLNADYLFELTPHFDLKPQMLVRTDMVKMSADFNLLAYYKKQYWLGAGYRTSDAIYFMGGWDIKERFRVGYCYDLTINQLSSISRGTHEIVLGFQLK